MVETKLTKEQEKCYREVVRTAKSEIQEINSKIESELEEVRKRITQLNEIKKASRQIYDGACLRLGEENELEKLEKEEQEEVEA